MRRSFAFALLATLVLPSALQAGEQIVPHESTHKQVLRITPTRNGLPVTLNTFSLASNGDLLACINDSNASGEGASPNWLQVYSPEGKLVRETELSFNATAINEAPSGIVFVAGTGQIAKIDAEGNVLTTADAPHLGDKEALKKQVEEQAKQQIEQVTKMYATQLESIEERIAKLKEKEELSDRDKMRMKSFETQRDMFAEQQKMMKESYAQVFNIDSMMARAMGITSLGVNSKHVFFCCSTGMGYDVWRTDHDFSSPEKVVGGLSGCCGQCDIQVTEENLVLAENTKFQVSLLDLDGERLTSFGSRNKNDPDGFGSCCNPMNVRCCSNGDILTAESSIGTIKRFNKEGEYLGTVGKAKIGGGCKHVAIGFDQKRDRYYMQYEDRNQICVLWPLSEAPEFTADELAAKEAREGLAKKLLGDGKKQSSEWSLNGKRIASSRSSSGGLSAALGSALTVAAGEEPTDGEEAVEEEVQEVVVMDGSVSYFRFHADGKLDMKGGYYEDSPNEWVAVSQNKKANTVTIEHLNDGVGLYSYRIEFQDDDTAKFTTMYGDQEMQSNVYHRIPVKEEKAAEEEEK